MRSIRAGILALGIGLVALSAPVAHAIPALQLYSPDAVYINDTWTIQSDTFELWVVGAVGDYGPISDVTLAASYYGSSGSIQILPGLASETYDQIKDKPGFKSGVENHAEYANANGHLFYDVGDFTGTSDQVYDYASPGSAKYGEIKSYMIHITGYDAVHFDAFDHYYTQTGRSATFKINGVFAPFSHDATGGGGSGGGGGSVPEPASLLLLAPGLVGLLIKRRKP